MSCSFSAIIFVGQFNSSTCRSSISAVEWTWLFSTMHYHGQFCHTPYSTFLQRCQRMDFKCFLHSWSICVFFFSTKLTFFLCLLSLSFQDIAPKVTPRLPKKAAAGAKDTAKPSTSTKKSKPKKLRKPHLEIEYEVETGPARSRVHQWGTGNVTI